MSLDNIVATVTLEVEVHLEYEPPRSTPAYSEMGYEYLVVRNVDMVSAIPGARAAAAALVGFDGFPDGDPDNLLMQGVIEGLGAVLPPETE